MRKQNTLLLLFLIIAVMLTIVSFASAQNKIEKRDQPVYNERRIADFTKPGGIVIGDAMPRAFLYGGRHAARTSDGILHVSWEDANYNFPYYAHSLDALGLTWSEPMNIPEALGFQNLDRCIMAKVSVDVTNDDIYLLPAPRVIGGVWRTQLTRSTDGGNTFCPFMDLGSKIGVPTAEVSWATMTIGADRILHITYAYQNQDMFYTRTNLAAADGAADLSGLVFTRADGVTAGSEAISFLPSAVVFQGTVVLDRNNDPHIIFSGDGGDDSFGDKTPYHIYYKTAAQAWGPIPPTRLQDELERCWGMPEMVFDKNNRGYYFLDRGRELRFEFGTWEPPTDPTSVTDFGTLNNGAGFEGAASLTTDIYPDIPVTTDENLFLPNAQVDDANDVIYLVANTNGYGNSFGSGGDIIALKLENASTLGAVAPANMPWKLHRWITSDGIEPLGDQGADVIYNPASTHLDIFWSGAGALTNEANYLDGTAVIPNIDAKPQSLNIGKSADNPINKGEELTITGTVKNSGTNALGPVAITISITDSNGYVLQSFNRSTPPLLAGGLTTLLTFGTWTVPDEKQNYSVTMRTNYNGDQATYNDQVSAGFYAYPALNQVLYVETFQDFKYMPDGVNHNGYPFPTWTARQTLFLQDVGGWTVVDSSDLAQFDYWNGWYVSDENDPNDIGGYIRHLSGIRNDTTYGDMPTGTPAQPQNELLYSPEITITKKAADNDLFVEFTENVQGTDGDNDFPIYAFVDATFDGGANWVPIVHRAKLGGGVINQIDVDIAYYSYDITDLAGAATSMQLRFWWRNMDNSGEFATWFIDNVTVIDRPAVEDTTSIYERNTLADQFKLQQNYPNPFNPTTQISYTLPETGKVKLVVYNVNGQEVATLINGTVKSGTHSVTFNASALPTGVYFYKLSTDKMESVKKMALIK